MRKAEMRKLVAIVLSPLLDAAPSNTCVFRMTQALIMSAWDRNVYF